MRAVFLLGPTASGKTAVALDSAQVYRGMDVGTAKPAREERERVPHHLIDIVDPDEPYSAGRFRDDALRLIAEIGARGRIPILAGGTMLYFRTLTRGLADLPGAQPEIRREIDARAAKSGWPALHAELAKVDPATAARLEPTDAQRIQRALEVHRLTGRALSDLHAEGAVAAPRLDALKISLEPSDRAVLHERIEKRFRAMLAAGLVEELVELRRRHEDAVDARGGLPAGVGHARGAGAGRDTRGARHRRHAPARQAPTHLAARHGRPREIRLPASRPCPGRRRARAGIPGGLIVPVVLEAHLQLGAIDELAALDLHVEHIDLGHAQVA